MLAWNGTQAVPYVPNSTLHSSCLPQLLPQSHKGMNPQCFGCQLKIVHIFLCAPEGEPGKIFPCLDGIMTVQPFLPVAQWGRFLRNHRGDYCTLCRQGDDFCIHSQIQPDFPACPGSKMFLQRYMMGAGGEEHRAGEGCCIGFRYSHRAGEILRQPGGKGCGIPGFRFLKIQHHSGAAHGPD